MDFDSGFFEGRPGTRVAFHHRNHTGADCEKVAALTLEFLVRYRNHPDSHFHQEFPECGRHQWQIDGCGILGNRGNNTQQMQALVRPVAVWHIEHLDPPADNMGELLGSGSVGPQRAADTEDLRCEPEGVTTIHRAGSFDSPQSWNTGCIRPLLHREFLSDTVGFAGSKGNDTSFGYQHRIVRIHEIRTGRLGIEHVTGPATTDTLGVLLKYQSDIEAAAKALAADDA